MIHHVALNGMEIIIVVHIYYFFQHMGRKPQKMGGKNIPTLQSVSFYTDGLQKYLRGLSTLEAACDGVQTLLYENDPVLFPSGHTGCSVSALTTQMFYPVYKVPQLHLQCSHCNYTIMINSNHVGRLMHVAHSATGSISQILESHMCYQSPRGTQQQQQQQQQQPPNHGPSPYAHYTSCYSSENQTYHLIYALHCLSNLIHSF
jgi:hypothetical protein